MLDFEQIQNNIHHINPFHATGLFLHPLKISENQSFSDVFRGYRNRSAAQNGLTAFIDNLKSRLKFTC